jgi:hypothetical protein
MFWPSKIVIGAVVVSRNPFCEEQEGDAMIGA